MEHICSLQVSSINLVWGITNSKQINMENTNTIIPSQIRLPFYKLTEFLWKANFHSPNMLRSSNIDKNFSYIIHKHKSNLIHFHSCDDAIQMHHMVLDVSIPYTVSLHSSDIHVKPLQDEAYLSNLCEMLKFAARLHVPSETLAGSIRQLCADYPPITTIRPMIPIPDVSSKSINTNKHMISVGSLLWENGFHDLVRAMVHLPDWSLDIIGDGIEYRHLVFLIHTYNLQDRVKLIYDISFNECRDIIGKATAYIHSGINQEISSHLLLAMALGKPVFVTNNIDINEVIHDKYNGIYIPIGEPLEMAKKIELLNDYDLMQRIGINARISIEEIFPPKLYMEKFVQFYQSAVYDLTSL